MSKVEQTGMGKSNMVVMPPFNEASPPPFAIGKRCLAQGEEIPVIKRSHALVSVLLLTCVLGSAQEAKEAKIKRALSAAPPSIVKTARIVDMDAKGNIAVLREGTNGFTCFPGKPGVVGNVPMCADEASMQWVNDWMAHKPKPTNTKPGIVYMLAGGTDWSATDPWATSGRFIKEPPHWMIMWPFDPKTSGLSDKESQDGTWIMWAGTPYAHLMINQRP
jgi:hypothetical protein